MTKTEKPASFTSVTGDLRNAFAVTIQVPRSKRIYNGPKFKYYQTAPHDEQRAFIEEGIKDWAFTLKYYEHTPSCTSKRLHLHGLIQFKGACDFPKFMADILQFFGTPKYAPDKLLKIEPIYNLEGWRKYIQKEQPTPKWKPVLKASDFPPEQ